MAATARAERIELLDALRGFALFGILLANMLYWSGWGVMTQEQRVAFAGADAVAWQYRFHHLLVDGKFYTIFSLLFGLGFAVQIARLSARGIEGLRVYRRRVLVLLGIGLVHSWLIWDATSSRSTPSWAWCFPSFTAGGPAAFSSPPPFSSSSSRPPACGCSSSSTGPPISSSTR
jgi:hypothetical protein